MVKRIVVFILFTLACLASRQQLFCQEANVTVAPEKASSEDISWVWGEVKSIDLTASRLNIVYTDYQTDEEKELVLNVDQNTKFENVKGLSDLKSGDTASIDYLIKDGKNIAENISVEKIGEMPEAPTMAGQIDLPQEKK